MIGLNVFFFFLSLNCVPSIQSLSYYEWILWMSGPPIDFFSYTINLCLSTQSTHIYIFSCKFNKLTGESTCIIDLSVGWFKLKIIEAEHDPYNDRTLNSKLLSNIFTLLNNLIPNNYYPYHELHTSSFHLKKKEKHHKHNLNFRHHNT